ncbi:family 78 glycoside hydrolase catalytic domain [Nonomuraea sp. NPDC050783]|uniref:family 78 glycoside hydrolase catalytic domain n=1 Tax=Nonomuraea sp. NPDC050783 TaxID=3154634 RepID=UPI003467C6F1
MNTTPATVTVSTPTVEHHREPLGIGESGPRISWKTTAPPDWVQRAYQLRFESHGRTETTEWITGDDSVLVPWARAPLVSRERVHLQVRVRGGAGPAGSWSPPLAVEAGLLRAEDWTAVAVAPQESDDRRPPLLRKEFRLPGQVERARLYVTAHGLYEAEVNGVRVGRDALTPGWTSYGHRLLYQTYDVTGLLNPGDNAIGAWLGDGWYRGRLGDHGGHASLYGTDVALLAQLEVVLADGRRVTVATDESWRGTYGPILAAGLLDGETHDARAERPGWSRPGFDDTGWSPVRVIARDPATLAAPTGPPVRCTEEIRPVSVTARPGDRLILDFGQNLAGRLRITVNGPAGHVVTLRHAEVLQDGELCVRPLREAISTDRYVLRGDGPETWEPRFTLHGFRYAEVTGWRGGDPAEEVVARVYHTDMAPTGWFTCSNDLVNQLHQNIRWSMRSNFVGLPTDCPQRDERLGWTGDLQIFAPTAAFLYDCHGMLGSWLRDVADEQLDDGTVPWYVPVIPGVSAWTPVRPGAGWGDVVTLAPWTLYQASGDTEVLARQYDSARRWVDLVARIAGPSHLWDSGFQGFQ